MQPPNDVRNFIHKRIIGAIGGGLTGGPGGAVGGFFGGGGGGRSGGQPIAPRTFVNPDRLTKAERRARGQFISSESGPCRSGMIRGSSGACVAVSSPRGSREAGGAAVMGRFGAGYVPDSEMRLTRECLPGDVLGMDNICYPKGSIKNSERKYPRGARPLGTPGEMAALRKAASFGRRMETTVKRMQKIGVLKRPSKGRPTPQPKRLTAGDGVRVVNVE